MTPWNGCDQCHLVAAECLPEGTVVCEVWSINQTLTNCNSHWGHWGRDLGVLNGSYVMNINKANCILTCCYINAPVCHVMWQCQSLTDTKHTSGRATERPMLCAQQPGVSSKLEQTLDLWRPSVSATICIITLTQQKDRGRGRGRERI